MASNANIVINDGEAMPIARTFTPDGIDGGVAVYSDRSGGIPVGYGKITMTRPKTPQDAQNGSYKCTLQLMLPKLEVIAGSDVAGFTPASRVAYNCVAKVEYWLPVRSTTQDRKNLRTLLANLINSTIPVDAVEDLEFVW